jgi:hypothetical protein
MIGWLRRLLGIDPPLPVGPRPSGWSKTFADLSAENRNLSREELEWARQYELEQLRSWARFPKDGEEFEVRSDKKVTLQIHWRAPYSTSAEGVLASGTRIRVFVHPEHTEPVGVQAIPVDERAFELRWVPEADRLASKYAGYSLTLMVAELNRDFELVSGKGTGAAA